MRPMQHSGPNVAQPLAVPLQCVRGVEKRLASGGLGSLLSVLLGRLGPAKGNPKRFVFASSFSRLHLHRPKDIVKKSVTTANPVLGPHKHFT